MYGFKMVFFDGVLLECLCKLIVEYFSVFGGEVCFNVWLKEIVLNEDNIVKYYLFLDGIIVEGDVYVFVMLGIFGY